MQNLNSSLVRECKFAKLYIFLKIKPFWHCMMGNHELDFCDRVPNENANYKI